jgi:haloalkane dehalogenase
MRLNQIQRGFGGGLVGTWLVIACTTNSTDTPTPTANPPSDTVTTISGLGPILRTPDTRFASLTGYTFAPNYVFLEGNDRLRMHYLDEGPRMGKVILLMHGNPSWVYNFRKLIPLLTQAGYRVICPDLIGFGRSDKPANRQAQTYDNQVLWIETFINKLNLSNIHMHCQDWGGLIGLRVAARNQALFAKIAISNTTLPDGTNVTPAFRAWRSSSQSISPYSNVMERSTFVELTPDEEIAYDAPFPEERFKAGPRELPLKVPIDPTDPESLENRQYWQTYRSWTVPVLTIFSEDDNISTGEQDKIRADFAGARGQNHAILKQASHFIREDQPAEMATRLRAFFN